MNDDDYVDDAEESTDAEEPDEQDVPEIGDPFAALYTSYQAELAERSRRYGAYLATPGYETDLRRAYKSLLISHPFKPGDLVQWKTFMRESRFPEYGAPAVVVAVEGPFQETKRAQQAFPQHDLLLAVLDGDQDLVTFSAASARLALWQNDEPDVSNQ